MKNKFCCQTGLIDSMAEKVPDLNGQVDHRFGTHGAADARIAVIACSQSTITGGNMNVNQSLAEMAIN
jgi:hypothetical protein